MSESVQSSKLPTSAYMQHVRTEIDAAAEVRQAERDREREQVAEIKRLYEELNSSQKNDIKHFLVPVVGSLELGIGGEVRWKQAAHNEIPNNGIEVGEPAREDHTEITLVIHVVDAAGNAVARAEICYILDQGQQLLVNRLWNKSARYRSSSCGISL